VHGETSDLTVLSVTKPYGSKVKLMGLRIRRIEGAKDFIALAQLWHELASRSGQTSPFLSHDWFWCCWHAVWPHQRPEILLIEEAGSPVAIIPLMHWRERLYGLPVRYLGLLECPDSPMGDMLIVGDHGRVIETFLDHLTARSDWDTVLLQNLPATSPTLKTLEAALPARLPWRRAGTLLSPYLTIAGQWADFYSAQSQGFNRTCQQMRDQLEHAGDLSIEEHRAVDARSPLFREVMEITRRRWKAGCRAAIMAMPRMPQFFSELTRRATKNGWLSLWLLRLNGRVIAMEYQLRNDGKTHALRTDADVAYQKISPESALSLAIVRSLFECGDVYEYNMGPGLTDNKLRWTTESQEMANVKLYRPGIYARLLCRVETAIVPAVRKWREQARAQVLLPPSLPGIG
jgi:CelD/BcsL family acetyltransferase involved in cellulose biosynthesis